MSRRIAPHLRPATCCPAWHYTSSLAGFTLVEVMVALAVFGITAAAITLSITSSLAMSQDSRDRMIAQGLACQLLDEILGNRYSEGNAMPYDIYLRPGSNEAATGNRSNFDDIDDFNGWTEEPPKDAWGIPLGQEDDWGGYRPPSARSASLHQFRREVRVAYVQPPNYSTPLPQGQVTDFRLIEVRVYRRKQDGGLILLGQASQVVAHTPTETW
ncbi:MAG: type IV pilus modification PilV family protein [Thermogutta sp.]